jgi:hypothetical protein
MKQLIILFLLSVLVSCSNLSGGLNNYPLNSNGEIIQITKEDSTVYILVEFPFSITRKTSVWFIGSDTCRIGQKINLK